jgi:hypothetical protein
MKRSILVRAILGASVLVVALASTASAAVPRRGVTPAIGVPPPYTIYVVDNVYSRYDGVGPSTGTGSGCYGPCTTSITDTYTWTNSWNASIKFTRGPIEATVGFSVSASGSRSYTNTFPVPSGKIGEIYFQDWYHVQLMHVHTATCTALGCSGYKYGTAWAQQWFRRIYSLHIG